MIKLLFYIGIIIILCYVIDYLYLKSREAFKELKKAYKDYKEAKQKLKEKI